MPKIKLLVTAILLALVQTAFAQGTRISGTVTDDFGPVMMANVVERDANNRIVTAAVTDVNGNFSMVVKNTKNRLTVSYVGSQPVSVPIGAKTHFAIKLGASKTTVKEVTVTSRRRTNADRDALFATLGSDFTRHDLMQAADKMGINRQTALTWAKRMS